MKKRITWILVAVVVAAVLVALLWGPIVSNVEQAKYNVVESHEAIEIRNYSPMIVAEVTVSGDLETAIGNGFRMIADYIFGNNVTSQKIAMTAPVTQLPSEKISMTAPVTQQGGEGHWQVRFVMPSSYSMKSLPKPNNEEVILKKITEKRFAVIRFSGRPKQDDLDNRTKYLEAFIENNMLQAVSGPTYAFFNPPWTLPFLRHNEVMIEIAK